MVDSLTDIFSPVDENNEKQWRQKKNPKRNRKKRRILAAPKRKRKRTMMNQIRGNRRGRYHRTLYKKKSSRSWKRENPKPKPKLPLSIPYYLKVEEGYGRLLGASKISHRIKLDAIHRKVMNTLRRATSESFRTPVTQFWRQTRSLETQKCFKIFTFYNPT